MSLNPAIARNGIVGLRNPSYIPVDGVWKITYTYNYSGSQIVFSDTKAFHIPPQSTIYVSSGFDGSGQQQYADSSITTVYERHYQVLLWSFDKTSLTVIPEGFSTSLNVGLPLCFPLR